MICVPYLLNVFELWYPMVREVGKTGMFAAIMMQLWRSDHKRRPKWKTTRNYSAMS